MKVWVLLYLNLPGYVDVPKFYINSQNIFFFNDKWFISLKLFGAIINSITSKLHLAFIYLLV